MRIELLTHRTMDLKDFDKVRASADKTCRRNIGTRLKGACHSKWVHYRIGLNRGT